MPTITFDRQSLLIDNRRIWIVGAGIDYARTPPETWRDRIAAAREAGFNTISTCCPWLLHEPRKGRFTFNGQSDLRGFVETCRDLGMWVILRPGPYVGDTYDGGGLPSWLSEIEGLKPREHNESFLERVAMYFRKLFAEVEDLQHTRSRKGVIIAVQNEQSWFCTNPEVSQPYLREVARHIRENGMTVPMISANELWADAEGAIETWSGSERLLSNLRQFRMVLPDIPRIVSELPASSPQIWGERDDGDRSPATAMRQFGQVLATASQPIVRPFHAGSNFGFLGGRLPGRADGFIGTAGAVSPPLGEAGARGEKFEKIKRIATFANNFGFVLGEVDPDSQSVTIDLSENDARAGSDTTVVPLRGGLGDIAFVFGSTTGGTKTTLLLDEGITLPIDLGDQSVGWYLIDVDLGGQARLDYSNLMPYALIDRKIAIFFGPERFEAKLSINGSDIDAVVPGGQKPVVAKHFGLTLVVCNQQQIDASLIRDGALYVGTRGFNEEGQPLPYEGFSQLTIVNAEQGATTTKQGTPRRKPTANKLTSWLAAPADMQAAGTSPRYASLKGPETLDACGTPSGYGWYRVICDAPSTKKYTCMLPDVGNRLHVFVNGELQGVVGAPPGAMGEPFSLKLPRGECTLVGLADHAGRFSSGNDIGRQKGWFGHLYEVAPLKGVRSKIIETDPVDPFAVRGFIIGQSKGRLSNERQVLWTFKHLKKSEIIMHIPEARASGTIVLNDQPIAYFAGRTGEGIMRLVLSPSKLDAFKRGNNELRFAPDSATIEDAEGDPADDILNAASLYECINNITGPGTWSFARWEPPAAGGFAEVTRNGAKDFVGKPCWWQTTFKVKETIYPVWFDTNGLSKGQVFVNGHNLGRYFSKTRTRRKVGPQMKLYVPRAWLDLEGDNEIQVFDEHGFAPYQTAITYGPDGDLD